MKLSILILTVLISACGPEGAGPAARPQKEAPPISVDPIEVGQDGQYLALLKPLNEAVTGAIDGAFTLSKENDEFIADLRFNGGPVTASLLHVQNVHFSDRCPAQEDDLNKDGFIDAVEGDAVYGDIIIPLDQDINSQRMGSGIWPVADAFGQYIYSAMASWEELMNDLHEEDINPEDNLGKITMPELKLDKLVVVVHGVASNTPLPETVRSNSRFANFETIPIACGVLTKVVHVPGRPPTEEPQIPEGPAGSPAGIDDGAGIFIPGLGDLRTL